MYVNVLSSILMKRFIDAIDDRIYRISGTSVSYNLINDRESESQRIMIDLRSVVDGNLICRICINDKDKCSDAFIIERVNPNNNLFGMPISIGCLYSIDIADRIFKEIQTHIIEWFKIKEDGE